MSFTGNEVIKCSVCEADKSVGEKSKYLLISGTSQYMCADCFGTPDKPQTGTDTNHLPMYQRWKCLTHNCGSYNFNNMGRHEMPNCVIIIEETVGLIRPKTFGGYNGDVSRKHFKDWINFHREKQQIHKTVQLNAKQIAKGPVNRRRRRYAYRS